MLLLYRRGYLAKYKAVANLIPPGSTVVDLCAGDCVIAPLVQAKGCKYTALDLNEGFIRWAREKGIDARFWNGAYDEIPEGDVICMQSSLYHFIDNDRALLQRMIAASRRMVIISEPVHNISAEGRSIPQVIARKITVVSGKEFGKRYSEESLAALMASLKGARARLVTRGRDALYVIEKDGAR